MRPYTEHPDRKLVSDALRLKIKDVGKLGDEGPLDHFSCGTALLVVDQEQITERLVGKVETDVAGNFPNGAVVLD